MSTQHTPGPWHVTDEGHVDSAFGAVAEIVGANNPDDETMPNARLIAAAPDLLEALQALMCDHGGSRAVSSDDDRAIKARAAIAKAEGGAA